MSSDSFIELVTHAKQVLLLGDKKAAGILINEVLTQDFANVEAWQILYQIMDSRQPFEVFQQEFAQKYFPDKAVLLRPQGQTFSEPSASIAPKKGSLDDTHPIPVIQRPTKKCPYCAEAILLEARVCRFCGRDLTSGPPEIVAEKRIQYAQNLAEFEKTLAGYERYVQEQALIAQRVGRTATTSWIVAVIGVFLIPIVIGVFVVIVAVISALWAGNDRKRAEENIVGARKMIETIQKNIIEIKTKLTMLA